VGQDQASIGAAGHNASTSHSAQDEQFVLYSVDTGETLADVSPDQKPINAPNQECAGSPRHELQRQI
jgi:hypothetical protein